MKIWGLLFALVASFSPAAAVPEAKIKLDPAGPVGVGELRIEIVFDRPMRAETTPRLRFDKGDSAPTAQGWADEKTFTATFAIPTDFPNGKNAIEVSQAVDLEGEVMKKRSAELLVDTQPPEIDQAVLALAESSAHTREAAFAVVPKGFKDKTTQIVAYYLSAEDGGGTRRGERFAKRTTYTATQDGEVALYAWAEDAAGNLSAAVRAAILVDTRAPEVVSAALDRTGVLGPGPVRAEVVFSEDMDPEVGLEVRFGPLAVEGAWTDARTWVGTFAIGGKLKDGAHALSIEGGADRAGHPLVAYSGASVQVDRTPPDVANARVIIEGGAPYSADKTLEFTFDGFTDDSRIVRFLYGFGDQRQSGGGTPSQDGERGVLADAPEGRNRVYVWAVDEAGNISAAISAEIVVDTERPSVEETRVGPAAADGGLPVALRFNRGMNPTAEPSVVLGGREVPGGWEVADTVRTWQGLYAVDASAPIGAVQLVVSGAFDFIDHPMREDYVRDVEIPGEAVYRYGKARLGENAAEAEAAFDQVLIAEPEHLEARYERAMLYGGQGLVDQQLAELEQVVRVDPYVPKAHYALAGIYSDRGQLDEAARALEKVVAIEQGGSGDAASPYAQPNHDLMRLLFAPFELVRAPQPTQSNVLHQSGVVDARNGDLDGAAQKLPQAIEAGAGPVARYNLGTVYLHQELWPEAEEELETAHKGGAEPFNSVRINLGAAQIARGRFKQAERTYGEIGSYPDPIYLNNLAVLQAKRGREAEALNTLAGLGAADAAILVSRGAILLQAERPTEAEAAFQQALAQDPTRAEAHLGLGEIRATQQDFAGARDAYRSAIAARLEYVDAHFGLGQVLLELGDSEGASVEFQRAVDIAPDFAEARAALGNAYKQQGLDDKAQAQYQKASEARKKSWAQRPKGMKVALLRFANNSGDGELDYLRVGLPEALTADLLQISNFDLVERIEIEKIMQEKNLREYGEVEGATEEIGKLLAVEGLVQGSLQLAGKDLVLTAKLMDLKGGIKAAATVSGKKKKVVELGRQLAVELAQQAGALTDPELQKQMLERQAPSEEAFKLASQAKEQLYAGDEAGAQALSAQALQADAAALDMVTGIDMVGEATRQGKTVAVMAFKDLKKDAKSAWLAQGIPDALSGDLSKIAGLYLVERNQIHALQQERGLVEAGEAEGAEMGQLLGAGVILLGSFGVDGKDLTITASLVSVELGNRIVSVNAQGKTDKFVEATGKLAIELSQALQVEVSRAEQALIEGKPPEAVEALKQLAELREMQAAEVEGQMVAVKPFKNVRGIPKHQWVSGMIAEGLSTELMRRGLPLVERAQLDQLYSEQTLVEAGEVQGLDAANSLGARKLGARYLVVGSYMARGSKKVRIDSRLLDTSTDAVLAAASTDGSTDKLFELNEELVERYLEAIQPEEMEGGKDDKPRLRLPTKWLLTLALTSGTGWGGTHYMFDQAEKDYLAGGDNYDDTNRYYRSRRGFKTSTQILASSLVFSWLWNNVLAR